MVKLLILALFSPGVLSTEKYPPYTSHFALTAAPPVLSRQPQLNDAPQTDGGHSSKGPPLSRRLGASLTVLDGPIKSGTPFSLVHRQAGQCSSSSSSNTASIDTGRSKAGSSSLSSRGSATSSRLNPDSGSSTGGSGSSSSSSSSSGSGSDCEGRTHMHGDGVQQTPVPESVASGSSWHWPWDPTDPPGPPVACGQGQGPVVGQGSAVHHQGVVGGPGSSSLRPGRSGVGGSSHGVFSAYKKDLAYGVPIDLDRDWLYLKEGDSFCTLDDVNGTKSQLSCSLETSYYATMVQLLRVALPSTTLTSLSTRRPCGTSSTGDGDMMCRNSKDDPRTNVFSLLLATPGGCTGVWGCLHAFSPGLTGTPLQHCCPSPTSPHVVQCTTNPPPAPAAAAAATTPLPPECWFYLTRVDAPSGAPISDGDLVTLESKAFGRFCSVSYDGTLLCVSALSSNATKNLFTLSLQPSQQLALASVQ
ncbi:MAG: hypothetical protein WDW36_001568 [Sanguina aurantia]